MTAKIRKPCCWCGAVLNPGNESTGVLDACQTCIDLAVEEQWPKVWTYYLINRPPGISCQPAGDIHRETWLPAWLLNFPEQDRHFLGKLVYDRKLTHDEVYAKELIPADLVERVAASLWGHWWGDSGRAPVELAKSYFSYSNEQLAEGAEYSNDAKYIQLIKSLGVTLDAVLAEWATY